MPGVPSLPGNPGSPKEEEKTHKSASYPQQDLFLPSLSHSIIKRYSISNIVSRLIVLKTMLRRVPLNPGPPGNPDPPGPPGGPGGPMGPASPF